MYSSASSSDKNCVETMSYSQPYDLTALTLCDSIFDNTNDDTAIKFMQIAPEVFPQFINMNNRQRRGNNNNNGNNMIPHQSDTETTQSNDTVYSKEDIQAAEQLLKISSAFITFQQAMNCESLSQQKRHKKHRNKHKNRIKSIESHHHHHHHRRKHRKKLKKKKLDRMDKIDMIQSMMNDMDCSLMHNNFYLYSKDITNLRQRYPFICHRDKCLKAFDTHSKLEKHQLIHLKCPKCHKQFKKRHIYLDHLQTNICWKEKEKLFKCKLCDRSFGTKSGLTKHEIVHKGQRKFQCRYCLKPYSVKWRYEKHEQKCAENA